MFCCSELLEPCGFETRALVIVASLVGVLWLCQVLVCLNDPKRSFGNTTLREGWHIFAVSARGERRVAAACARARAGAPGPREGRVVERTSTVKMSSLCT